MDAALDFSADAPPPPGLSRRRKAAMIVQMVLSEGQPLSLSKLPEEVQLDLTRELGALRTVDRTTVETVAREFMQDLEGVGLGAVGGMEAAIAALRDRISPAAAARLRAEIAKGGKEPWTAVCALPREELVVLMQAESTEIAAVALSKLPVGKAAEVLGKLPGERARRIALAVSRTSKVTPETVLRIGRALSAQYATKPPTEFPGSPAQRVGAILNSSQAATREEVLEALDAEDPIFANGVRSAIFTFADIPDRISASDLAKVVRNVDGTALVTALAAATGLSGPEANAAQFLLDNISQRMAESLREEMTDRGKPRRAEGEEAMAAVIAAIRDAVESGEIKMIEPEEEDG